MGADRVVANGDTANKVGTYQLAIAAKHHGIPFYVAAPSSSCDLHLESGQQIIIEERPGQELTDVNGVRIAAPGKPSLGESGRPHSIWAPPGRYSSPSTGLDVICLLGQRQLLGVETSWRSNSRSEFQTRELEKLEQIFCHSPPRFSYLKKK